MSIHLVNIVPRHERRLRLLFDNTVGAGGFGTSTATLAYYTVTSQDNLGTSPAVIAALIVPNTPGGVELSLANDLVQGGIYTVSAIGVPAVDSTVTDATAFTAFQLPSAPIIANLEVPTDDYATLLYGTDILHNGTDFVEGLDGDLATVSGLPCAEQDIRRRLLANGLPWDPTFGPYLRRYVDGVVTAVPTLRGELTRQALQDDRVQDAQATFSFAPSDVAIAYFDILITLIGGDQIGPINVPIRTG